MAQFDLYRTPNPETSEAIPYLLDVQADLLHNLCTEGGCPALHGNGVGQSGSA
ncbi:CcdB family protein [Trichlorobacter ammonificans]|uniref:CcdB family protein n=1 Tax=Trichlorobacter ammonificans TaxID=2916410 RepID=UPI0027378473|nr:CcdB family protein [Trichlorobacter ammonificans]